MPASARKSSLGTARRGPQKAHIPYRGDNPEVGKKTGLVVQHVELKSDGFEPFEEVMEQVDRRMPQKVAGRRKKSVGTPRRVEQFDDDENGEMSMDLDDTPVRQFTSTRLPSTPYHLNRGSSSTRPVARTSDIDFDQIPSPRRQSAGQRQSVNARPGPSILKSSITREVVPSSDSPDEGAGYDQGGMDDYGGFDEGPQEDSPEQTTPRRTSFMQMDEDDGDDEPNVDLDLHISPLQLKRDKGKGKPTREEIPEDGEEDDEIDIHISSKQSKTRKKHSREITPEEDVEAEIEQGLEAVQEESEIEEEAVELEVKEPPKKKVKVTETRTKSKSSSKKENRPQREGVRRSKREPYKPLEWWRGEKLVYGKTEVSGPVLVPPIREIIRIPKETPLPLGVKRKRSRAKSRAPTEVEAAPVPVPVPVPAVDPEEGWDEETQPNCTVLKYKKGEEIFRKIACTAKMVRPKMAVTKDWYYDKIFGDAEFIAAGQLVIPPRGRKPSKPAKDNTYIFYVIEGAVNLKVHDTSLILATGGMFMVPRGNTYFIENISNREAKLFFTQARKVAPEEDELSPSKPRTSTGGTVSAGPAALRSSSSGPLTNGQRPQVNGKQRAKTNGV